MKTVTPKSKKEKPTRKLSENVAVFSGATKKIVKKSAKKSTKKAPKKSGVRIATRNLKKAAGKVLGRRKPIKKKKPRNTREPLPDPCKFSDIPKAFRISIRQAMYWLFEQYNPGNISVDFATKVAQRIKPDTKFNQWHLYFHRRKYRESRYGKI